MLGGVHLSECVLGGVRLSECVRWCMFECVFQCMHFTVGMVCYSVYIVCSIHFAIIIIIAS